MEGNIERAQLVPLTGTRVFDTEELMDIHLANITPGSTVMIKEGIGIGKWTCRWCPGKNITKHFDEGANSTEDIYWYSHNKLWQLIPAFG